MSDPCATVMSLDKVAMRYGDGPDVLYDLDLDLEPGSFHFLVGDSGTGKTSLLRLMALSHMPHRGKVSVFGREIKDLSRDELSKLRRRIGVIFQDFRLLDHLSAYDNVALPLRIGGTDDQQINSYVSELLAWFGLSGLIEAKPPKLSMGQRQLLCVARAVVGRPALLLADEPTSNIDSRNAGRLMHLLCQLRTFGTTVVIATHNDDLLRRYRFPILRIESGRITRGGHAALAAAD